jgi:hypothetical protein
LSELFEQFYFLKKAAACFGKGGANITTVKGFKTWEDQAKANEINKVIIPKVCAKILEILTPQNLSENAAKGLVV